MTEPAWREGATPAELRRVAELDAAWLRLDEARRAIAAEKHRILARGHRRARDRRKAENKR
jgi:hypothetical protein